MKYIPASAIRAKDLTQILSRSVHYRAAKTCSVFGLSLSYDKPQIMVDRIFNMVESGSRSVINFVNAHCINTMNDDADYRRVLEKSDMLLPDGIGIDIAARAFKQEKPDNLNGTDLFPLLCDRAAVEGAGIFLLGGSPGAAEGTAAWARENWPSLRVRGTQHGFFDPADEEAIIERINNSGAAMLFVGMGVPLQEKWIARNRHRLTVPVALGVGGLFDYYSGRIPRAPAAVRAMRSEWIWRLAMEPRRMADRYIAGNARFLGRVAKEAVQVRGFAKTCDDAAKRALDIVAATLAIIGLLPIFLATALAIRLEDKGPVFFKQMRIGVNGRPFGMLKFRSMFTDAEKRRAELLAQSDRKGTCFKMQDDPRITKTGKLIRRYSIDELPQLINVLRGDMSLVGPRPALATEVREYAGRQMERLRGKPGITCSWQVKGRASIPFHRQAIMDRAYLRKRNFITDLRLLAATIPAVVTARGAY
ncbi:WecB/TagA/CpsF family glycosyltransferase [Erythrobacter litoralis]|uniref:WecB/TagA/CpsF family glycosyltransferase n=1 Tax=Erythrobacter litoralis TaxID=39960 RepID=UPI00243539E6|nr:WecB/TagA/CpsF family glycosyltransferase [Erythrobacter litoralis]MDG6080291.1 WecB/TagA/CpsF family glycosyltransferase [Erythrobacter litoralis]